MKLFNVIQRSTEFGTFRSRDNFLSFILKITFYAIPAILLGNYTDVIVKKLQKNKVLGNDTLYYILIQSLITVSTMYLIILYLTDYTREFHISVAGAYFIVLYFGIQTNYIEMIKEYMNQGWAKPSPVTPVLNIKRSSMANPL